MQKDARHCQFQLSAGYFKASLCYVVCHSGWICNHLDCHGIFDNDHIPEANQPLLYLASNEKEIALTGNEVDTVTYSQNTLARQPPEKGALRRLWRVEFLMPTLKLIQLLFCRLLIYASLTALYLHPSSVLCTLIQW